MTDQAEVVLAAVLPSRRDRLQMVLTRLEPEHFRREELRNIYRMLERYYDVTADVLPAKTLKDLLARQQIEVSRSLLYEELWQRLEDMDVVDHEFRYAIDALRDGRSEQLTGEAIATSMEILERGVVVDGLERRGHRAAREFLYGELGRVDRLGSGEDAPEGDVRHEGQDIKQDYAERKAGKGQGGVLTGISQVDRVTGGVQNGDLVMVCGYTGAGKSMCATQIAWHAATQQGKNVFFATSETIRAQVRRRLIARHSRLPQFGIPDGLNAQDLKAGTLSPALEDQMMMVVDDLTNNPAYGRLYLTQVPRGGTLGFLESRLNRQAASWDIDLVVMDYLALLRAERKRQTQREELSEILKDAKVLATTFDGGRGVPFISPWAMSQFAYKEALRNGEYQLANLADTSEAEKSADVIMAMLLLPDQASEVKMQVLKNRDGAVPRAFALEVDFRCAFLGQRQTAEIGAGLLEGVV